MLPPAFLVYLGGSKKKKKVFPCKIRKEISFLVAQSRNRFSSIVAGDFDNALSSQQRSRVLAKVRSVILDIKRESLRRKGAL